VTIGNSAGAVAVGVLVLLCQACDRTPPSSRPPDSATSPETVPVAPAPAGQSEVEQPQENTTPPRAEASKPAASAPPVKMPPVRATTPAPPTVIQKPGLPEQEKQPAAPRADQAPAVPPPAPPVRVATLDLGSLEKRLRDTKAIGVFTKLSLKNEVDDLLEQFRDFHQSRDQTRLAKLRQAYDLLLLKVLSLLQDGDPGLARDVSSSREALWNILVDPDKFKNL
jgi:hypothetical protein